ncbi:MAG: RagB/SusD family nutrient uptake outer membrane protein [Bacteroidales bacterium]|jgi:hypothetical protein|nr:RagB/SusD family nutrient uptake outer membrane protein [Bacteroidales bacterium]
MKKIFSIIFIAAVLMGISSCKDFLTVVPQSSLVADNYYDSEAKVRANTASLYGFVWNDFQICFMWMAGDELAGDLYYTYAQEGQFYYLSFTSGNTYINDGWTGLFRVVSFANSIINDMPSAASGNGVSQTVINHALAEARFFRGLAYYYLTEYWGAVPIITNATENITSNNLFVKRNTQSSIYEFIRRDLVFAMDNLPEKDSEAGRVTKWSAEGLLSKLYLTMASHLDDAASADNFANAKKYAADVIENSGLSLYPDYSTMFDIGANNSDESLCAIQCFVGGYGYGNPRNCAWGRSSVICDQCWGAGKGPTLSLQNCYDSSDKRRKWVYMTLNDYYPNLDKSNGGYTYYFVNRDPADNSVRLEESSQMLAHIKKYVIGKASDTDGGVGDSQDAANNVYLLRLSDVYMVYVEASIGSGSSTTDPLAISSFNAIHSTRAGLAPVSSVTYSQLLKERRCEFAFESCDWFDVKRYFYRDPDAAIAYLNNMNRENYYQFISGTDQSLENTRSSYEIVEPDVKLTFNKSQMYLPIPASVTTTAPILNEDPVDYKFSNEE